MSFDFPDWCRPRDRPTSIYLLQGPEAGDHQGHVQADHGWETLKTEKDHYNFLKELESGHDLSLTVSKEPLSGLELMKQELSHSAVLENVTGFDRDMLENIVLWLVINYHSCFLIGWYFLNMCHHCQGQVDSRDHRGETLPALSWGHQDRGLGQGAGQPWHRAGAGAGGGARRCGGSEGSPELIQLYSDGWKPAFIVDRGQHDGQSDVSILSQKITNFLPSNNYQDSPSSLSNSLPSSGSSMDGVLDQR